MKICPFKKKGTEKPDEPTKEEWLSEAMPLIELAHVQDRIAHYQEAFNALSWATANRTHDLDEATPNMPVSEHRFVLDLHQMNSDRQAAARNAIAMSNGLLSYHSAGSLQAKGWDIESIVGQIALDQIGALRLQLADSISTYWQDYYPGTLPIAHKSIWYFNINLDNLDTYIKPLIEKYEDPKYAQLIILGSETPQTGNWVDDYFQAFLTASESLPASVTVAGGDVIAQIADDDRLNPDGQHFRLSTFFLNENYGDVQDLPGFLEYRQRLPNILDLPTALLEEKSMAGHPLISLMTQLPIDSARVDFVDQEIYGNKSRNELWLEPDLAPNGIVLQRPPSAELRATAEATGVDLTDHGTSFFKLYNPDQLTLNLRDSSGLLTISPAQIGPDDWQTLVAVTANGPLPVPTYLEVLGTASEVIKRLEVLELDFKLFPVSFWFLDPLSPSDCDFDAVWAAANRVLGRQANTFCYPVASIGTDARNQILHIDGMENKRQPIGMTAATEVLFRDTLAATETVAHSINVIFTWELLLPKSTRPQEFYLDGICMDIGADDPRPVIAVDIVEVLHNLPSVIGSVVAHEICHWFGHFTTNDTDAEEFDHHLGGEDTGSTSYHFNLMHFSRHLDNLSLTKRQAELIHQVVGNVI